jgi:hypothetical protein
MASSGMFRRVALLGTTLEPQEPHGVTSQKTPFFIVTAVKTSNLTEHSAVIGNYIMNNYRNTILQKKGTKMICNTNYKHKTLGM